MTRPSDRHLDDAELDALVSVSSDRVLDSGQLSEPELAEVQRHVESCEDCNRKVQMHRDVQRGISRLGPAQPVQDGLGCPKEADWLQVAAGLVPEIRTRELMSHAAQCDHCGPLLRNAVEALSDETTPEEESALAGLNSARKDWQRDLAGKLGHGVESTRVAQAGSQWWKGVVPWPRPVFVVGALAAVAVAGWLGVNMLRTPSAEQLLAHAYTEHRTLEMRIPGAKYAPMRVERSTGGSSLDKSPALLKAEALIGESLKRNPNNPAWLQAKARADLLDGNSESAIKSLQRALETQPGSSQLLTDLASAYFERAEAADRAIDYGNAIESLGKALAKTPDDPVALFNRALVSERMFLYTQAVDDWEHYLRVDPRGEWADDARRRLAVVRGKLQQHDRSQAEPLLSPSQIARANIDEATLRRKVDERIDEYLHVALVDWLPRAYPANDPNESSNDYRSALGLLARTTAERHDDPWLTNLLSHTSSSHFPSAVAALARSMTTSDGGDFESAQALAIEAERAFFLANNSAGTMQSRYQRIYTLHLAQQGSPCLRAASDLRGNIGSLQYRWLRIQFRLDEGTCDWLVGNLGHARLNYRLALHDAETSGYPSVYLRAVNHLAGIDSASGDESLSWTQTMRGLARYWSANVPPMQGYNLYFALHEVADWKHQPYLDVVVWRQAIATIDSNSDVVLLAAAHSYLGNAADAADMPNLAEREFREASRIFAAAPNSTSTQIAHIEAETRLADLEVFHGQASRAYDRLRVLQPEISNLSDNLVAIIFYRALGEAQFQRGALKEADAALRAALTLAELNLRSLRREDTREKWNQLSRTAHTLVRLKLREGNTQDALEIWEWYQGSALLSDKQSFPSSWPSSTQLAAGPALPPLNEVTSHLPMQTRETFLSYAVFSDGIQVWVYDNRGISSNWIAFPADELGILVRHFQHLCSDPSSDLDLLQQDARRLYDLLIAPVERSISTERTLIIESDDAVRNLPFEALLSSDGHYLAEKIPLVSSLGLYYSDALRTESNLSSHSSALFVSVPSPRTNEGEPLPPLNDATAEADDAASRFDSPVLLQGRDATGNRLLQHLRTTTIFHFAGHAVASPSRSGLLLADGLFDAESIQTTNLSSLQLVVLSACDTAFGPDDKPLDPESLARAFLRTGTPHVIVSRWRIDSAAARSFMQRFYSSLLSGQSVPTSLEAAAAALRNRPETKHPYYWSAFYALGRSGT